MKKRILSALAVLSLTALIYSCTKDSLESDTIEQTKEINSNRGTLLTLDEDENLDDQGNKIIYENQNSRQNVSPNFYDNHFYQAVLLGDNLEKKTLLRAVEAQGVDLGELKLNEVKRFNSNNSEVLLYSIDFIEYEFAQLAIYKKDNIYQICKSDLTKINNTTRQFTLKTMDNKVVYSLKVNNENKLGEIVTNSNTTFNNFSNKVYDLRTKEKSSDSKQTCCRKKSSWSSCMSCTTSACGSTWGCTAALALFPKEMLSGFAVSCIGAGADAWC